MTKSARISTAREWAAKNEEEEIIDLPSGARVKVRKLHMFEVAALGHISFSVVGSVLKSIAAFESPASKDGDFAWTSVTEEDINNMLDLFRRTAVVAVVEPEVKFDPAPEEEDIVDVKKIPFEDLVVIFDKSIRKGATDMLPFRGEERPGANGRSSSSALRPKAKRTTRNK